MAITVAVKKTTVPGARQKKEVDIALDNSYPNPAGYVLTPATFGLGRIASLIFAGGATLAAGLYEPVFVKTYLTDGSNDIASVAVHLVVGTTGAEVANAVDVSAVTLAFVVEGV